MADIHFVRTAENIDCCHPPPTTSSTPTTFATMNGYNDPSAPQQSVVTIPAGPTNQPHILVRNLNRDEVTFHLSGVEMSYANSLRRTMMADVPTIGA